MSIFRRDSADLRLSAYLDGELSPADRTAVEDLATRDDAVRTRLSELERVHHALGTTDVSRDVALPAPDELYERIERTIRVRRPEPAWWHRSISIPLPAAAAAIAVMVTVVAVVVNGLSVTTDGRAVAGAANGGPIASSGPVNVQVMVDADQTENLLRWLNEQNQVEQISIQLPDSASFQLRGEPVLLRPGLPGEEESDGLEHADLIPLEDLAE